MHVDIYIPPSDHPLQPYLHSIWGCEARGEYRREMIFPKGIVDILFNLAEPFAMGMWNGSGPNLVKPAPYLAGMQLGALQSEPKGKVMLFGISLKAETCSAILPLPAREIAGRFLDATLVFREADEIIDRLHGASSFRERCGIAIGWMTKRLAPEPQGEMVVRACRLLNALPTGTGIDRVAADLNLSSRHLRRLFLHHLGVGPSGYIRLRRFIRAIGLISSTTNLTEIAHAACYYDQAHFCRDFKDIAGMTPGAYQSQAGPVPGHLFLA